MVCYDKKKKKKKKICDIEIFETFVSFVVGMFYEKYALYNRNLWVTNLIK